MRICEGPHKRELVKFRARGELHEDDELDAVDVEKGDGLSLDYEPLYQLNSHQNAGRSETSSVKK